MYFAPQSVIPFVLEGGFRDRRSKFVGNMMRIFLLPPLFQIDVSNAEDATKLFSVPDFVGDLCKGMFTIELEGK